LNVGRFDTEINADVFYAWLSQELLTSRPGNSVIVLDNATFHQRHEALEAREKAE